MYRETVRRGVAALALAGGLALAGARPAAAAEPGPLSTSLGWFAGLWSEGVSNLVSFWEAVTRQSDDSDKDKGFGVDPNGNPIAIDTSPPADTGG